MKILKLYLKHYLPLGLSGIQEFTYLPEKQLQIILGTNGSGKSSVLRALSPLPGDAKEFKVDGVKEITIVHNGCSYTLRSDIAKSSRHSFIKDGLELNDGGTITVQRELVNTEFGYTDAIHKILTGHIMFCDMSPQQRKDLIYRVANIDLDYVMSVFNAIKTTHRDITGALKHIQTKIENLSDIVNPEELVTLEKTTETLREEVKLLQPYSNPSAESENDARHKLDNALNDLSQYLNSKEWNFSKARFARFTDLSEMKEELNDHVAALFHSDKEVTRLQEQLTQVESALANFQGNPNCTKEEVTEKLNLLKQQLDTIPITGINSNKIDGIYHSTTGLLHALRLELDHCTVIGETFTREFLDLTETGHQALLERHQRLVVDKSSVEAKFNIAKIHRESDVQCPKCHYVIRDEQSMCDRDYDILESNLQRVTTELLRVEETIVDEQETYETVLLYKRTLDNVSRLFTRYSDAVEFIGLTSPMDVITSPEPLYSKLLTLLDSIEQERSRQSIVKDIEQQEMLLSVLNANQGDPLPDRFIALEKELGEVHSQKQVIRVCQERVSRAIQIFERLVESVQRAEHLKMNVAKAYVHLANITASETITVKLDTTLDQLAQCNLQLNEYESRKRTLQDLEKDLEELSAKRETHALLIASLSPKEGLIADCLRNSIGAFLMDVNKIINQIWEYQLEVLPSDTEKDLDFKFPLFTPGNTTPDIALGSEGQKEVINFAVMLVSMLYMKLIDYPLYVDEIGINFDPTHRKNLVMFIKELLETNHCSQMFLISHYSSEYGSMSNANTVVLNPDNIVVPETYNTNVTIV